MKTILNILWFVFGGFFSALYYFVIGILLCITIIGIPFGKQCFKFSGLYLWPFKKKVNTNFWKHPIINIIWLLFFGWELFLLNIASACMCFITIIGIPFAFQWLKLAMLSLFPFGARV